MTKMRHQCILAVLVVAVIFPLLFLGQKASCYSLKAPTTRRREFVGSLCTKTAQFILFAPTIAYAKEQPSTLDADLNLLKESTEVLDSLIENWQKATTDCTYADVPRELLEAKNKKQLLEKASEFALFDKSTSVVSCKRVNGVVRDYIGATGKGPVVGAEKRLLKSTVVDLVDDDYLDEYFSEAESFSQLMSKAKTLSYTAGHNDFDSMNNFEEGKETGEGSKILDAAKEAIVEANGSLKKALSLISVAS